jgi:hypothetical protein
MFTITLIIDVVADSTANATVVIVQKLENFFAASVHLSLISHTC